MTIANLEASKENVSAPERGPASRGYGDLVWRDFRSNRLAMLGLATIIFVVLVAALCPLLANQRPLYMRAVMETDYDSALLTVIEQGNLLAAGELDDDAERRESVRLTERGFERMAEHLAPDDAAEAQKLRGELLPLFSAQAELDFDALDAMMVRLEGFFDVSLQPVARFPAIRALGPGEVYTLVLLLTFPLLLVLLRLKTGFLAALAGWLILAGAITVVWKQLYPTIQDTRPYRRMIDAPAFAESGGVAIRTPVPYGENENIIGDARQAPTWLIPTAERPPDQNWHWLGTDTNGRDVLARMIYGARVSMLIGVVAVGIYTIIGILIGAIAGYFGGWIDMTVSRLIEVVICFPPLILILAVQAFLAPSIINIILALAALWWTGVARLQRAEFLRLVNLDFVQAVRALGGSNARIIFLHILPNGLGPILVMVSFGIAGSILIESALSFLGFGVPQPMASWGDLLNNGRNAIRETWWLTIFPGAAIFLTVTCFNLIGEGLRDALDPLKER